ncbi:MAG: YhfC family intramembrane metalloprotease [Oscillospiraceae bacterium]|nr:YhfC family intramembrane metalloprotease [Oscillospiraceae bacterium]
MKKVKLLFIGAISLIVFGLLLPQPIQALLVVIDTPVKEFFAAHQLSLCVIVGLIQGISEECGYCFVLKHIKNEPPENTPFWFGLGRSVLHTLFDIVTIIIAFSNIWVFIFAVVSRIFSFAAMIELTKIDYFSYQRKKVLYLGLSVLLHALLNGVLYAHELQLFNAAANSDTWFILVFSITVIAVSSIISKKELRKGIDNY